jgi:hypothetical protein
MKRLFIFRLKFKLPMNQLSNPHYLYLHSSIATQNQVQNYIMSLIEKFEIAFDTKLNKEFIVNTVTKFDGTPLKHSYVWFKSEVVAGLFLNKDLEGKDRVEQYPDPNHDTSEADKKFQEFMNESIPVGTRWVDLVDEEEQLYKNTIKKIISRPKESLVPFEGIEPTPEQKLKNPDLGMISVEFYPCKITGRSNVSYSKLFAVHVAKDVTEAQIRKHFEPFSTNKSCNTKKQEYPIVQIDRKSNPHSVTVNYCPTTMDGIFALCMIKKLVIHEKCTLNFDLYRQN